MPGKRDTASGKGRRSESTPTEVRRSLDKGGGLPQLVRSLPSALEAERAARIFHAVSDPARLRILWALERAPLCPCLLREVEPMANSALSYHLSLLRRASLVTTTARSNYRVYRTTALAKRFLAFAKGAQP